MHKDPIMCEWVKCYDLEKEPKIENYGFFTDLIEEFSAGCYDVSGNEIKDENGETFVEDEWTVSMDGCGFDWLMTMESYITRHFNKYFYYLHRSWTEMKKEETIENEKKQPKLKNNDKTSKGLSARQWGLLFYFTSMSQNVIYDNFASSEKTSLRGILSFMTGLSEASFNDMLTPKESVRQTQEDILVISEKIKKVLPETYKRMNAWLDDEDKK